MVNRPGIAEGHWCESGRHGRPFGFLIVVELCLCWRDVPDGTEQSMMVEPHRDLRHGVSELKVDVGPGYRVYYAKRGGDRSTQTKDIIRAIRLVQTYGE